MPQVALKPEQCSPGIPTQQSRQASAFLTSLHRNRPGGKHRSQGELLCAVQKEWICRRLGTYKLMLSNRLWQCFNQDLQCCLFHRWSIPKKWSSQMQLPRNPSTHSWSPLRTGQRKSPSISSSETLLHLWRRQWGPCAIWKTPGVSVLECFSSGTILLLQICQVAENSVVLF